MNISHYAKAITAAVGGLITVLTVALIPLHLLPENLQWIATALAAVTTSATAFLVWLTKNENVIEQDAQALKDVIDLLTGHGTALADHGSQIQDLAGWRNWAHTTLENVVAAVHSAPTAVEKIVAEAKKNPVQAVIDAPAEVASVAGPLIGSVEELLARNPIR